MNTWVGAMKLLAGLSCGLGVSAWSSSAAAQAAADAQRSIPWQTATSITAVGALAIPVLLPRIFYSDPETTVGWKARWHVSALAPTMTLTALTLLNEFALKSAIGANRPACGGRVPCQDSDPYETLSSHPFAASSGLGQSTAVFIVDTIEWSGGRVNAGAFVGDVAVPLTLAVVTAAGRAAGNWEDGGSVLLSSGIGLASARSLG